MTMSSCTPWQGGFGTRGFTTLEVVSVQGGRGPEGMTGMHTGIHALTVACEAVCSPF